MRCRANFSSLQGEATCRAGMRHGSPGCSPCQDLPNGNSVAIVANLALRRRPNEPVWLLLSCFGYSDIGKPKTLWWLSCSYSLHRLLIDMRLLARLARVIP